MAATINLKVKSDFDQASADLKKFGNLSEAQAKKIEKFRDSFKGEQIDKFIDKNVRAGAAIKATSGEMASLEIQQKNLNREMQKLIRNGLDPQDESVQRLAKEYDKLEKEVQKNKDAQKGMEAATKAASAGLIAIGTAAAAASGFLVKNAFDTAQAGDEYAKAGRRIGLTAEELQELSFAADRQGVSGEELIKGLEKLNKNVGDLRAGYGSLNTVLKETNPELLEQLENAQSNEEAFNLSVNALNALDNQLEKASLAQALFGKSGLKLLTVTEAGVEGLNELREEARNYGLISNESAAQSEAFVDAVTNLQASFKGITNELAARMIPSFSGVLIKITEFISDSDKLVDTLEVIGITLAAVTGGLITFLAITKGAAALQTLATAFRVLNAAIAANPIAFIASAIVTILIPAIILLVKNWDKVVIVLSTTIETLKERFALFANGVATVWTVATNSLKIKFLELGKVIVDKVLDGIVKLLELAAKIPFIGDKFQGLIDNVDDLKEGYAALTAEAIANSEETIAAAKKEREEVKKTSLENIQTIKDEGDARLAELDKQKEENDKAQLEMEKALEEHEKEKTDITLTALEERLDVLNNKEAIAMRKNITTFEGFLDERMKQEEIAANDRIRFLARERKRILELENLSSVERAAAVKAVNNLIAKETIKIAEKTAEEVAAEWDNNVSMMIGIFETGVDVIGDLVEGELGNAFETIGSKLSEIGAASGNVYLALAGTIIEAIGKIENFLRSVQRVGDVVKAKIEEVNLEIQSVIFDQTKDRIDREYNLEIDRLDKLEEKRQEYEAEELARFNRIESEDQMLYQAELDRLDMLESARRKFHNEELNRIDELEDEKIQAFLDTLSVQEREALRAAGVIQESTLERIEREKYAAERAGDEATYERLKNEEIIETIRAEAAEKRTRELKDQAEAEQMLADSKERLAEQEAIRLEATEENRLRLLEDFEEARIEAEEDRLKAEETYRWKMAAWDYDRAVYERDLRVAEAEASRGAALAELPWYTSSADRSAVKAVYDDLISTIENTSIPSPPAFAQGGSFLTAGSQTIRVGDNMGGVERVTVEPVSSSGANVDNSMLENRPIIIRIGEGEFEAWLEEAYDNQRIRVNPGAIGA